VEWKGSNRKPKVVEEHGEQKKKRGKTLKTKEHHWRSQTAKFNVRVVVGILAGRRKAFGEDILST